MGNPRSVASNGKELMLTVDDQGRIALSKEVRDQLGIEPNDRIPANLVGSVLKINPIPSSKLEIATADRESWDNTTPADAAETIFGPMDQ